MQCRRRRSLIVRDQFYDLLEGTAPLSFAGWRRIFSCHHGTPIHERKIL